MRPWIALAASLVLAGCNANSRDSVTFSCEAKDDARPGDSRRVVFRFEDRFLFIRTDTGGTDNVCTQDRTRLCDVKMTADTLTLRQEVERPYCGWRPLVSTTLDIDRHSGAFTFTQQGCEPDEDMRLTGHCEMTLND